MVSRSDYATRREKRASRAGGAGPSENMTRLPPLACSEPGPWQDSQPTFWLAVSVLLAHS